MNTFHLRLARTRNSSLGPPREIDPTTHRTISDALPRLNKQRQVHDVAEQTPVDRCSLTLGVAKVMKMCE